MKKKKIFHTKLLRKEKSKKVTNNCFDVQFQDSFPFPCSLERLKSLGFFDVSMFFREYSER